MNGNRYRGFGSIAGVVFCTAMVATLAAFNCTSWERRTYQSLAVSKAVIDKAGSDYNAGYYQDAQGVHHTFPKTQKAQDLISTARDLQDAAVSSFKEYLYWKQAAESALAGDAATAQTNLDNAQAQLADAVAKIAALIPEIQALYTEVKGGNTNSAT